ncbi:hypothetical protein JB92DRAFT_3094615 [Gautieria morchelliformis]|nr:hypothetical protein JB92DRAFT_3094615 [Gautieria morchelliformis]
MRSSIPHGPPEVVTFRYKHEMGSEMAIFPNAWFYVTCKPVAYGLIDVHVVPPSLPRSSVTKSYAPLYPDSSKQDVPPYPDSVSSSHSHAPPYPDSPPPRYPGSPKKQLHPHLPPAGADCGYGYGFGWHDQMQVPDPYPEPQFYAESRVRRNYDPFDPGPQEGADRRSAGWSSTSPKGANPGWGGLGLFSRETAEAHPARKGLVTLDRIVRAYKPAASKDHRAVRPPSRLSSQGLGNAGLIWYSSRIDPT